MNKKREAFVDLDGVVFDFRAGRDAWVERTSAPAELFKHTVGAYLNLPVMEGAREGLHQLQSLGFDVWFATKIPDRNAHAAYEKLICIGREFPHLYNRVIITPNKGTLGDSTSILIDDRPHKARIENYTGTFYHFGNGQWDWTSIIADLKSKT